MQEEVLQLSLMKSENLPSSQMRLVLRLQELSDRFRRD